MHSLLFGFERIVLLGTTNRNTLMQEKNRIYNYNPKILPFKGEYLLVVDTTANTKELQKMLINLRKIYPRLFVLTVVPKQKNNLHHTIKPLPKIPLWKQIVTDKEWLSIFALLGMLVYFFVKEIFDLFVLRKSQKALKSQQESIEKELLAHHF